MPESSKTLTDTKTTVAFNQHNLPTDMFNDNFSVKNEYDMDKSPNNIVEDMIDGVGK